MRSRKVNFSIGALLITLIGAGASLIIMRTAADVETYHDLDAYASRALDAQMAQQAAERAQER